MLTVLAFLKTHWRKVAAVVALVVAFGAGRFATPPKVVTKVETVVKVETREVVKVVKVMAAARVKVVDRVVTKEGEVREHIVIKEVVKEVAAAERKTEANVSETAKTEKTIASDAPRLTVSLLAGVDLSPAWQPITGAGPLALGLSVQYRIVGPVTVGVFGLHTGVIGASLGVTF